MLYLKDQNGEHFAFIGALTNSIRSLLNYMVREKKLADKDHVEISMNVLINVVANTILEFAEGGTFDIWVDTIAEGLKEWNKKLSQQPKGKTND
jgi:hypothetical protein